jgi:hypothetical protein
LDKINNDSLEYIFYGIFITAIIVFVIYFYRSIAAKGIQRIKIFTLAILGIAILANFLFILTISYLGLDFTEYLPARLILRPNHEYVRLALKSGLLVYFTAAFIILLSGKKIRFLKSVWVVFLLFNLADILLNFYFYITWVKPVAISNPKTIAEMILSHSVDFRREKFLQYMIYPFFWMVLSFIAIKKIAKEQKRNDEQDHYKEVNELLSSAHDSPAHK